MTQPSRLLPLLLCAASTVVLAQPNRIQSRIDRTQPVILAGHVHAYVNANNDRGLVASGFRLPHMVLQFKPTAAQQTVLDQLLADQQNPASANFRQWLTPEQYADQFALSAGDAAKVVTWLQSQGFTVESLPPSRTSVTFSGTAGQVQVTFGTEIHRYQVNGQSHFANATDPKIPVALAPLVTSFRGLNDFKLRTRAHLNPHYNVSGIGHVLAPDDFATIYDIAQLYTQGVNGSGQSIAIVGQTALSANGADATNFWSRFGITSKLTQTLVPGQQNPGISAGDVDEAALDVEWAGAVARGATINFVYSDDATLSAQYIVEHAVAPVMSMSYGSCEQIWGLTLLPGLRQLAQQANAEGITWLAASGDSGAADCDAYASVAEGGLTVDEPGSIPEVTSMGGTQISDLSTYWTTANSNTEESARTYNPSEEAAWNDTATNLAAGQGILAGGGGASAFFPQPSWQTGIPGVPNDGFRHVPDVSFNSSVYQVPYYVLCTDFQCAEPPAEYFGGTSAATPTMAGVVALLNQSLQTKGLGNINPMLYRLSQSSPARFMTSRWAITWCPAPMPRPAATAISWRDTARGRAMIRRPASGRWMWPNSCKTGARPCRPARS